MMGSFSLFETSIVSVERIKEYSELPSEDSWTNENNKPDDKWPNKGEIEFRNYSVKYRIELDYVLKSLNFKINSCEKVI
jgi:ABC-type multidrug transport system fused ATPase/permease subunit